VKDRSPITTALQKLDWIAKLSKDSCAAGVPEDPEAVRELLNRIVKDVRAVVALLSDTSDRSDLSDNKSKERPGLIPTHGGYRNLKSFQVAEILYDGTVLFCNRHVDKRSRTHDQMVQAARSGRQNIAEGSMASATSKKTELKLTNVAKASQEELLLDFEDFLRQHRMRQWDKNDQEALAVRQKYRSFPGEWFEKSDLSDRSNLSDKERLDPYDIANTTPEVAANTLICMANQGIYLLKRQIERLERDFVEEGGFTEKLYRVRTQRRRRQ
jgi:four helix bundle suffix protein